MRDYDWLIPVSFGLGLSVLIATPIMTQTEAGDWLSFAGAMIGVVVAVAGALAVERAKVRAARDEAASRLRGALDKVEKAMTFLSVLAEGSEIERAMGLRYRALQGLPAIAALEYAVSRVDIVDVALWSEINSITSTFATLKPALTEGQELYLENPLPAEKLDQRAVLLQRLANLIIPSVKKAREMALERY